MPYSGKYNKRATITKVFDGSTDSMNVPSEKSIEFGKRWGQLVGRGGREFFYAGEVDSETTHLFRTPSDSGTRAIKTNWYLTIEGNRYEIVSKLDVPGRREEIQLELKQVT